jgi:hypothetical protein
MTGDVLPADVEFARGLLSSNLSDSEILEHLAVRGIHPDKAAQLLDDLRHGREPAVEGHFALGSRVHPSSRRTSAPRKTRPAGSGSRARRRAVVVACLILVAFFVLWVTWQTFFKHAADSPKAPTGINQHPLPAASGN